jgi:ubiquinone/menaquinone biosynthesis C-methylase UbiE
LSDKPAFSNVDHTADPAHAVRTLDAAGALQQVQAAKRLTFDLLGMRSGEYILDVGCGTGEDAQALAALVGPSGRVVGVDASGVMIAEARKRAQGSKLPVEFLVGDVQRLDFAADTFDACRVNRVFAHLADPRRALAEMARVTRRNGRIVCFERDWEAHLIDASDRAATRIIANYLSDRFEHGWVGRALRGLFVEAELTDIAVVPETTILTDYTIFDQIMELSTHVPRLAEMGRLTADQAAAWLREQEERGRTGRFFAAVTGFAVRGYKA